MKILMVYPKYPDTFWSFKHALSFISKKAAVPPLGLITVSAMFPQSWDKKLIDFNVGKKLKDKDVAWADYVFISAMYIQKESVDQIIEMCKHQNVKIIAGGPLFTQESENYPEIDHFILNEAEITFPLFLDDLEKGLKPQRIYKTQEFADITTSPIPDYYLLDRKKYAFMNIQTSRGCPYDCDFCEITALLGRKVRIKNTDQIIDELNALYELNWRGSVFIVDDNFIGNKKRIKKDMLPALQEWMKLHEYPFTFNTQTSINLADDKELLSLMTDAGFHSTFIGIETPVAESLQCCNKVQNQNRDMVESVKTIQNAGMQVSGGFIVGFDDDSVNIFERQIDFIKQSGIVSAMVGLLNAPKNTKLYERLQKQNRLTTEATGSNTDQSMNFTPKMDYNELLDGYKKIIKGIYSIKPYYKRIREFSLNYQPTDVNHNKIQLFQILAFLKTILLIGIIGRGRLEYWKLVFWTLFHRPALFQDVITFIVYGYHFRIVYGLKK